MWLLRYIGAASRHNMMSDERVRYQVNGEIIRRTLDLSDERQSTISQPIWDGVSMTEASMHNAKPMSRAQLGSERRTIGALILFFWVGFQIVYFAQAVLASNPQEIGPLFLIKKVAKFSVQPVEVTIVSAGGIICLGGYMALRRVRQLPLWSQLLTATIIALLTSASFSVAVSVVSMWFGSHWPELTMRFFIFDSLRWLPAFGLWAGVALTVTYNFEMRDRERRLALAQAQAHEAQVEALRYQINPHLLYNTLNSIAALILDKQNDLAEDMVMRLSDFFRSSLSKPQHLDVPLIDEITFQRLYLSIEEMRFGDRLAYEFNIDPNAEQVRVPNFILQPLIENALKHAIKPAGQTTLLLVTAKKIGNQLLLDVTDNGPGRSSRSGTGIGLKNVKNRLYSHFGDDAKVETLSQGSGFSVRLSIPA